MDLVPISQLTHTVCFVLPRRELLQNSDDAEAKSVQLHFFTAAGAAAADRAAAAAGAAASSDASTAEPAGLVERPAATVPDLKAAEITRYVFKNDGMPFRPEDWARLKSIASVNPDESKVGAFGVRTRPSFTSDALDSDADLASTSFRSASTACSR